MKQMSLTKSGDSYRLTRKVDHIHHHFTFNTQQEMADAYVLIAEALLEKPSQLLTKMREAEHLVAQYDEELAKTHEKNAGLQDTVEKLTERLARMEGVS